MSSVLYTPRVILAGLKLAPQDLKSVIPAICIALNETSLNHLGRHYEGIDRCPLEVMTGIQLSRPILRILLEGTAFIRAKTIEHARALHVIKIDDLEEHLTAVHKDVSFAVDARRPKAIMAHNRATNII